MRLRVRHKLVLLSTLILVGVGTAFVLVSASLTRRSVEEDFRGRATAFARAIAATISTRAELQSGGVLQSEVAQIQAARDDVLQLDVLAIDAAGSQVVATTNPAARLPFTSREAAQVLRGRVVSRLAGLPSHRWEVLAPIVLDDAVVGALAAAFSPDPGDRLATRLRRSAIGLTAAAVLVMGILMGVAVRVVVDRPVQRFMTAIARLEAGEPSVPVEVAGADEFATLARHFNDTMGRLQRFSDELQARVAEATSELDRRYREVQRLNSLLFDLQRRLSRAERLALTGRVMAEVAHEVGTPLHSVAGHLELLRKDLPPALWVGDVGRRLEIVETQVRRLIDIIAQLLDLTRAVPAPSGPVDLNALVRDTHDLVRPAVDAAGLRLDLDLADGLPMVHGQAAQLQQVILNLLTNAVDATPGGGAVRVITRGGPRPGTVELAVTDTGRGIPPAHQKRIFEPFFTTKDAGRGTGLGLAVTSQIIRAHGGRIEVVSEEGRGSTFRVSVPAEAPA